MTTYATDTEGTSTADSWAAGGIMFAACALMIIGVFQFFEGLSAVLKGGYYHVSSNYAYHISVSGWGWIHLIWGIVVLMAGLYLFTGATWARVIAIGVAGLSAIANFLYIPYYPFWALLIIALDVFVIWAVATRGGDLRT